MRRSLHTLVAFLLVCWIFFVVASPVVDLPLTTRTADPNSFALAEFALWLTLFTLVLLFVVQVQEALPPGAERRGIASPLIC